MARWSHDVENRREQIIDAAMRVFVRKGYTRATNKDVACEAGITTGLIYYYFKNQEDLLQAVLESRSAFQLISSISADDLEQPPEIFLPEIIKRVLSSLELEQVEGMVRVVASEIPTNIQITQIASDFARRTINMIEHYLQIQAKKGIVRSDIDFTLVGQIIGGGMLGFILRKYLFHEESLNHYSYDDVSRAITTTVLQGICLQ